MRSHAMRMKKSGKWPKKVRNSFGVCTAPWISALGAETGRSSNAPSFFPPVALLMPYGESMILGSDGWRRLPKQHLFTILSRDRGWSLEMANDDNAIDWFSGQLSMMRGFPNWSYVPIFHVPTTPAREATLTFPSSISRAAGGE